MKTAPLPVPLAAVWFYPEGRCAAFEGQDGIIIHSERCLGRVVLDEPCPN